MFTQCFISTVQELTTLAKVCARRLTGQRCQLCLNTVSHWPNNMIITLFCIIWSHQKNNENFFQKLEIQAKISSKRSSIFPSFVLCSSIKFVLPFFHHLRLTDSINTFVYLQLKSYQVYLTNVCLDHNWLGRWRVNKSEWNRSHVQGSQLLIR